MFLHKSSLPHVLSPQSYSSPEIFDVELKRLFLSGWHIVGCWADLARDGDFITTNVLGKPILVRNFGGTLHAFLNVCTHRHSLLTSRPKGRSSTLACQYHGWEYHADGTTAKIPDAQSFKPLPTGPECLRKFRVEVAGPSVFVNIDDAASSLGDQYPELAAVFSEFPVDRWRRSGQWSYDFAVNWKIPVENTIESYHVPLVHPYTLVNYAAPEDMEHELHPRVGILRSPIVAPAVYRYVTERLLSWLEPGCSNRYRLYHGYPHLFFIRIDAMLQVMTVLPTASQRCRMSVWVFTLRSAQENLITRLLNWSWGHFKCAIIRRILAEDAALYPALQQGMNVSPFHGRLSVREELIYGFQAYLAREIGVPELTNQLR